MLYSPELHTPTALDEQLAAIYKKSPDTILVGSLGRAAAFTAIGQSPLTEFAAREQHPLFTDQTARDIDVIFGDAGNTKNESPFEVDSHVFFDPRTKIIRSGDDWFLVSECKKFAEQLHPAVMEPVEVETVFGIQCKTVSLETHLALFGLKGVMGPKVIKSKGILMRAAEISDENLPAELYEPFTRLKEIDKKGIYPFLQRCYHNVLPESARAKLQPITRPLKYILP